jgi:hypothetical protein
METTVKIEAGAIIVVKNCIEKTWLLELTHVFYPVVEGSVIAAVEGSVIAAIEDKHWARAKAWAHGPMFVTKLDGGERVLTHFDYQRPFDIVPKDDLVLYTHFVCKTSRFFELLN